MQRGFLERGLGMGKGGGRDDRGGATVVERPMVRNPEDANVWVRALEQ